jgi:hypothetical protein
MSVLKTLYSDAFGIFSMQLYLINNVEFVSVLVTIVPVFQTASGKSCTILPKLAELSVLCTHFHTARHISTKFSMTVANLTLASFRQLKRPFFQFKYSQYIWNPFKNIFSANSLTNVRRSVLISFAIDAAQKKMKQKNCLPSMFML